MGTKELPSRPNLEQYKNQAKTLLKSLRAGDADALRCIRRHLRLANATDVEPHSGRLLLADAQLVIAREHSFESWPKFAKHITALSRKSSPTAKFESAVDAVISGDAAALQRLLLESPELIRTRSTRGHRSTL